MISESQKTLLSLVAEVWALAPDLRLGQLMTNLELLGDDAFDRVLGDIEDDQLLAILERHREELAARLAHADPGPHDGPDGSHD